MRFNNSGARAPVTPAESPASERTGFLHPLARRLARGALVAVSRLGDRVLVRGTEVLALAEGIAVVADALVDGLDRLDGCAQPPAPVTATVDLGLALRVSELERAVERLAGPEVAWSGETGHPCPHCGCTRAERLCGAAVSGDFVYARCVECRAVALVLLANAGPQEVLP